VHNKCYMLTKVVSQTHANILRLNGIYTVSDLSRTKASVVSSLLDIGSDTSAAIILAAMDYSCIYRREYYTFLSQPHTNPMNSTKISEELGIDIDLADKIVSIGFIAGREIVMAARSGKIIEKVDITPEENGSLADAGIDDTEIISQYGHPAHVGNEWNELEVQNVPPGISTVICYDGPPWNKWALAARFNRALFKPGYVMVAKHVGLTDLPGFIHIESGDKYEIYRPE